MEKQATFGSGCFWCTEAFFQRLRGVISVKSGYSGGHRENPTYEEVCTGSTGHAEVVHMVYNEADISYEELLEVFWKTHDPTTLNSQGNDIGTQYRSVIFYHDGHQKEKASTYKKELDAAGVWHAPIVTEIVPFERFHPAEKYHDDYFNRNRQQPYCSFIAAPKVRKFRELFKGRLRY